ncbi:MULTISPECIES: YggT family protein [Desulfovibrio]|jgi:YggT family protein|uniref:YggT family protein n=2 Tax=Desulfovibrionaceae TaxID=194924 RepID=UPI000427C680|nr:MULTISPECIES: YggT family protein [Desulfovibrio]MDY0305483.1 YggT family protein [Desulfovibrionaceae bacterium]HMM39716.1 YggT family protein [Desulfovibrio sp.]
MGYMLDILTGVVNIIHMILTAYMWVVIISALLSWVNPDPYNPIVRFLRNVTEPVFYWIRRRLPFVVVGGFDLSPILVIVGIQLLDSILIRVFSRMAMSMVGV